jgi:uncharacterized protein
MGQALATLDLRSLHLAPGAAAVRRLRVPPVALRLGGQDHRVEPDEPEVELTVSRSLSGLHLRIATSVDLVGPCWRCLADARAHLEVGSEEFSAEGRDPDAPFDEDLDSAYVHDHTLDLAAWSRDAIAEAVPATVLCRPDCAGLCPHCGADLNDGRCGCEPEEHDRRWDGLKVVAERLAADRSDRH